MKVTDKFDLQGYNKNEDLIHKKTEDKSQLKIKKRKISIYDW